MEEFFVAVEKLDRLQLRGRRVLVDGEAAARGVVSTASYEARAFGCGSAMPMWRGPRVRLAAGQNVELGEAPPVKPGAQAFGRPRIPARGHRGREWPERAGPRG